MDSTIVEHQLDTDSREFLDQIVDPVNDREPDLDVDGLSESFPVRVRRFLAFGRED